MGRERERKLKGCGAKAQARASLHNVDSPRKKRTQEEERGSFGGLVVEPIFIIQVSAKH